MTKEEEQLIGVLREHPEGCTDNLLKQKVLPPPHSTMYVSVFTLPLSVSISLLAG